ncbi:MAG: RHS repeat-associated core domain-containing protein, partial [Myxococcota bacterium]
MSVDGFGRSITQVFDDYGRRTSVDDPNTGTTVFQIDPLGQVTRMTDGRGMTTETRYDLLGRTVREIRPNSTRTWEYDHGSNGVGRIYREFSDEGLTRTFGYETYGRLSRVDYDVVNGASSEQFEVRYTYNSRSEIETFAFPKTVGGPDFQVRYRYDDFGHLTHIEDSSAQSLLWRWAHGGPENQVGEVELGNGLDTQRLFNTNTGMLERLTTAAAPATPIRDVTYTWDANRNLIQHADVRQGLTENFQYDANNRLTTWTGTHINESFSYGVDGNLRSKPGVPSLTYSSTDKPHAVREALGFQYNYDDVGNQTLRPKPVSNLPTTIEYNAFNKPTRVLGTSQDATFAYDANQTRFRKTVDGKETLYLHDGYERTTTPAGIVQHRMLVRSPTGPVMVVRFDGSTTGSSWTREDLYLHTDVRGSLEAVTSATGAIVERRSYTPFGERRHSDWSQTGALASPTDSNYMVGFTGHEDEYEFGWVNMDGRTYDPRLGRFMSADPLVAELYNSQNLNRFSYVFNNPMSLIDPSGFEAEPILDDRKPTENIIIRARGGGGN